MRRLRFNALLKSDTVISERSATAGGHACLDYLPGACFLGACASALYRELGQRWLPSEAVSYSTKLIGWVEIGA